MTDCISRSRATPRSPGDTLTSTLPSRQLDNRRPVLRLDKRNKSFIQIRSINSSRELGSRVRDDQHPFRVQQPGGSTVPRSDRLSKIRLLQRRCVRELSVSVNSTTETPFIQTGGERRATRAADTRFPPRGQTFPSQTDGGVHGTGEETVGEAGPLSSTPCPEQN
ncbi:hypothetical protein EYF80_036266 [Liparis tanakae]|uniref:Uncharacterized protein n=1 Tax=Liparis tanakae TaxID=230148 RepID=A0A4Z2GKY0_9TELE|nr:hypothetical protein EYF80_036266 [Liparis tanakae]